MKKLLDEFKEFIAGGNLVELAIAFIIGLAIKDLITSLVNNVIMATVAAIVGKPNFSDITIHWGAQTATGYKHQIFIGTFFTDLVNFLIIAAVVFFMFKAYKGLVERVKGPKAVEEAPTEVELLTQIRDSLQQRQG